MANNGLFTINKFAKISRLTRDTLVHYDNLGLLSPIYRGTNNYRYYSAEQLSVVNVIRTLQEMGMTLGEIKSLTHNMNPELISEALEQQNIIIEQKIKEWFRAQKLLFTIRKTINSILDVDEDRITISFMKAEAIILGDLNDYSGGRNDHDALLSFYNTMQTKYSDLNLNYPVWSTFSAARIKQGDWVLPDRYYFYNPEGRDKKPSSLYAIGYTRGRSGQRDKLYKRIIEYIDQNGYDICGDAYEEYPLNEVCITDDTNYLMRVMITVCEKSENLL